MKNPQKLKKILAKLFILLLLGSWTFFVVDLPEVKADSIDISPSADSYMDAAASTTNYSTATTIGLRMWTSSYIRRGIIKFDIAGAIGASKTISSATLIITIASNSGHAKTVNIHKVQQSPARDWVNAEVTHAKYTSASSWTAAGGDFDATVSATSAVGAWDAAGTTDSFDLTTDAQNFYATSSTNYGWVIKLLGDTSGAGQYVNYASYDHATVSYRPILRVVYSSAGSSYNQSGFRFFNNTDTADVGSVLADANTAATLSATGDAFRLRTLVHVSSAELASSGENFKLQFVGKGSGTCASPSGGTPATYTDVGTSTVISYKDNTTPADGAALTVNANDPTHSTDTIVPQTYEEANNFTNSQAAIPAGQDGKWDFALYDNGATASTAYCFKIVTSAGVDLTTYDQYPQITTGPPTLTINVSAGSKATTRNSGDTSQYVHDTSCTGASTCSVFTLASTGTISVTSIKVTETGTAAANTDLASLALYYDTDGNWADVGAETLFGTTTAFEADQTSTVTGTLNLTASQTAYVYLMYDLAKSSVYPKGGQTVNFQIAASTDVVSDGAESCSSCPVSLAGTQTVLPTADSVTYTLGSNGGRSSDAATISGHGFGAPLDASSRQDCSTATVNEKGCVRFVSGGNATVSGSDITSWSNTSIAFTISSSLASYGGSSALEVVAAGQGTATDLSYKIYPKISSVSATEGRESDSINITGDHFGTSVGANQVTFDGNSTTCASWGETSLTSCTVVPTIADDDDSATLRAYQGTGGDNSLYHDYGTAFTLLPDITSTTVCNKSTTPSWPADSAREYSSGDSACSNNLKDGHVVLSGTHFGAAGTLTVLGSTATQETVASGPCASAYSATCITVQVPTGIADNSYTGSIVVTRTADSKTDTYSGLRVLPRIASTTPVDLKAARSDTIAISGNHLCQSGSCPTSFSLTDKVSFTSADVTSGTSTWTDTSVPSITVPTAASDGAMYVVSNTNYASNSLTFDVKFKPDVSGSTNRSPADSSTGASANPTLTGITFADGTGDSDSHSLTDWQVRHSSDSDWDSLEWSRTSSSAETSTIVNATNGTFANGDSGQTTLDASTAYTWRYRYKDNSGVSSAEWSEWSTGWAFTTQAAGYPSSGYLISSTFDTAVSGGSAPNSIMWKGTLPSTAHVKFQFAGSNSTDGPWTYYGPSDSTDAFYEPAAASTPMKIELNALNNKRYYRYKVTLVPTNDLTQTPTVTDIIFNWSP